MRILTVHQETVFTPCLTVFWGKNASSLFIRVCDFSFLHKVRDICIKYRNLASGVLFYLQPFRSAYDACHIFRECYLIIRSESCILIEFICELRASICKGISATSDFSHVHMSQTMDNLFAGKFSFQFLFQDPKKQQSNKTCEETSLCPVISLLVNRPGFEFWFYDAEGFLSLPASRLIFTIPEESSSRYVHTA